MLQGRQCPAVLEVPSAAFPVARGDGDARKIAA